MMPDMIGVIVSLLTTSWTAHEFKSSMTVPPGCEPPPTLLNEWVRVVGA